MDYVPYVCPRAPHFLLIGHSAAVFTVRHESGLLGGHFNGDAPDQNLISIALKKAVIDYLHNNLQGSNAPLMLSRVAVFMSYFALYYPLLSIPKRNRCSRTAIVSGT